MKSRVAPFFAVLLLVAVASCVELTGQRITMRYDEAKDELQILFCHDGIHESPPARNTEGPKQIEEYVANGDILVLDWPGSIQMKEMKHSAESSSPAVEAMCAAVVSSVRSTPVGRYRDPDGRVGAAQLVVISRAKELVGKINAAISETVLREPTSSDSAWPLTVKAMRDGARQGRAWLAIEGHSLRFRFPAHPAEWVRGKAGFVKAILEGWQEAKEGKSNDNRTAFFIQFLALSPLSLEESSEGVSIRLGDPKRPLPLRFAMRDVYNTKLEASVTAAVPAELDDALARRLIAAEGTKADAGVEAIAAWGPPEDAARALLGRAASSDPAVRGVALERLRRLGEAWNREGSLPRAPEATEPDDKTNRRLDAWREWYRGVLTFPSGD